jgi:ABC toxin N-terminal region
MKRRTEQTLRLTTTTIRTLDDARLGSVIGGSDSAARALKVYRIWDANRSVFLYPDNYLDPDVP